MSDTTGLSEIETFFVFTFLFGFFFSLERHIQYCVVRSRGITRPGQGQTKRKKNAEYKQSINNRIRSHSSRHSPTRPVAKTSTASRPVKFKATIVTYYRLTLRTAIQVPDREFISNIVHCPRFHFILIYKFLQSRFIIIV